MGSFTVDCSLGPRQDARREEPVTTQSRRRLAVVTTESFVSPFSGTHSSAPTSRVFSRTPGVVGL